MIVDLDRARAVETKPDRSWVTAADRTCEEEIVAIVRAVFPDHAILGEEGGQRTNDALTSPNRARSCSIVHLPLRHRCCYDQACAY